MRKEDKLVDHSSLPSDECRMSFTTTREPKTSPSPPFKRKSGVVPKLKRKAIQQYAARNRRLKNFGYTSYAEYLKSDEWTWIKIKARSLGGKWLECYCCGSKENIQYHHKRYGTIGKGLRLDCIVPVCRVCHYLIHERTKTANVSIKGATNSLRRSRRRKGLSIGWADDFL